LSPTISIDSRPPALISTRYSLAIANPVLARRLPSELARANGNDVVLAIRRIDIQQHGHAELVAGLLLGGGGGGGGGGGRGQAVLDRFDGQNVDVLVLEVEATLVQRLGRLDVELVFALDVLVVFFDLHKVWGQRRPALGSEDGPEVDAAGVDADGCDEGFVRVPLDSGEGPSFSL
jgi:hypothetical protein